LVRLERLFWKGFDGTGPNSGMSARATQPAAARGAKVLPLTDRGCNIHGVVNHSVTAVGLRRERAMKIGNWKMLPLTSSRRSRASDPIKVNSLIAYKDDERIVLHRVEKVREDGTREVFIIKASPKILKTDH
jgi:hypothetical protein